MQFKNDEIQLLLDGLRKIKRKISAKLENESLRGDLKYKTEKELMSCVELMKKLRIEIIEQK